MTSFGIYIMTYPGDYHLALALIKSIQHFSPGIPITILPGDGFTHKDHPFTQFPVLTSNEKKWELFTFMDRKFRLFEGPYKYFLYLDADIICTADFRSLFKALEETKDSPGIFANLPHKYYGQTTSKPFGDDRKVKITGGQLGTVEEIKKFDASFFDEIDQQYPFNAGLFAAHRDAFQYKELFEFKMREIFFFEKVLMKPYDCRNSYLFYVDQGRFNYMAWKKKLPIYSLYPHAHYIWGGKPFPFNVKEVLNKECAIPFIHWAGCPRPSASLFNKAPLFYLYAKMWGFLGYKPSLFTSVPGKDIWDFFCTKKKISEIVNFTLQDARKIVRTYFAAFKRRLP